MASKRFHLPPEIWLFFGSWILFLLFIQFPLAKSYDEAHYVPSALQFLNLVPNQNYEHPPLGKELMAIGIGLFGDRPIGWRIMSTLAGAFTLVGMYRWGLALFASQASALLVALLSFLNFILYVQARIGMLDTFMMAFLVWGWALSTGPVVSRRGRAAAGLCFGLAVACKWAAVFGLVGVWGVIFYDWIFKMFALALNKVFAPALNKNPPNFKAISQAVVDLGILPVAAYFATFLPFLWIERAPPYTLLDLIGMQWKMYEGQLHVISPHTYMSQWYGWPFIARPIWYAFERYESVARGVLCMGNPFLMWGGLACVLIAAYRGWKERSRSALLIVYFYVIYTFCWAIVPRKISFYYYYYPAAMVLSLAWVYVLQAWVDSKPSSSGSKKTESVFSSRATWAVLAVSFTLFIYYLPILAGFKIPVNGFTRWTWFRSWI